MKTLWLTDRLVKRRLERETMAYLERLAQQPILASQHDATDLLGELRAEEGPKVCLGETTWGESVEIPLKELVQSCALTTGGTGSGKTMFALLIIETILSLLPNLDGMAFGILDAKGELFERTLCLLGQRLRELDEKDQEKLLERVAIIDFSSREAVSPYNILARWPSTDSDYFLMSRLETLRELLPAGEKLSLRGTTVLKYALALLSEFGLPLTYLDSLFSSETLRARLVARSRQESIRSYFQRHFPQEARQTIAALRARMDSLLASEGVRLALAGSSAPDFRKLQDAGKIVLINCGGPAITRGVRLLLQGLVLSDIRQGIFARANDPPVAYLWFADEAQNFFLTRQQQENMADILCMARSFGSYFSFLCQNISTAVPDGRILETMHTNIRWSMTFRTTPGDAAFLKPALPVTGRRERPELNPFRTPGVYSTQEERSLLLDGIAHLPDQTGYLWLRTRSPQAIKIKTRSLSLPEGEAFRQAVGVLCQDASIGGRLNRAEYARLVEERDRQWLEGENENQNLHEVMQKTYQLQEQP